MRVCVRVCVCVCVRACVCVCATATAEVTGKPQLYCSDIVLAESDCHVVDHTSSKSRLTSPASERAAKLEDVRTEKSWEKYQGILDNPAKMLAVSMHQRMCSPRESGGEVTASRKTDLLFLEYLSGAFIAESETDISQL